MLLLTSRKGRARSVSMVCTGPLWLADVPNSWWRPLGLHVPHWCCSRSTSFFPVDLKYWKLGLCWSEQRKTEPETGKDIPTQNEIAWHKVKSLAQAVQTLPLVKGRVPGSKPILLWPNRDLNTAFLWLPFQNYYPSPWFSTRNDFCLPVLHLTISRSIFNCYKWGRRL